MNESINTKRLFLLEKKQAEFLYGAIFTIVASTGLNFIVLSYILWDVSDHRGIIIWDILNILALSFRIVLTWLFKKRNSNKSTRPWRHIFAFSVFLSAVTLGSGALLIFPDTSIAHQTFIYFIAGGMIAGASSTLGSRFEIYCLFAFIALIPYIVKAFSIGTAIHNTMGFILSVFLIFIVMGVYKIYQIIKRSLLLEINNGDLLSSLEVQIKEKEYAYAIKSQFLANMSHEIRTPMNAVITMNKMALATHLDERQRELLTKVDESSQSLLFIINDILDFSKIEAGKLTLEKIEFTLSDILHKLSTLCTIQAAHKDIELIIHIKEDVPQQLIGDPVRIEQILLNPLNNAIKFTHSGDVSLRISVLAKNDRQARLLFTISDTGIGMDTEQSSSLFEEFFQADLSTTRKYGGTGLGLTIAKRLTELMNGSIRVESLKGRGTTFDIELELGIAENGSAIPLDFAHTQRLNVLLLVPHKKTKEAISAMLAQLNWSLTSCSSPSELQNLIAKERPPFDLALIDYRFSPDEITRFLSHFHDFFRSITHRFIIGNALERDALALQTIPEHSVSVTAFLTKPLLVETITKKLAGFYSVELPQKVNDTLENAKKRLFELGKRNILIAEDNVTNQLILKLAFEGSAFSLTIAENGLKAVDATLDAMTPYDLILMDIQMPVMDGYEAATKIRESNEYEDVPIIALTANVLAEYELKAKEIGMNGFVTKPIDMENFYTTLYTWLK